MIAHNWLASRWRTIPGLPCPARPSMPCQAHHHLLRSHQPGCTKTANAAAGGTTTMLHNSCLAPPCTSTSSLVHFTTTKPAKSPPNSSTCRPERGRGNPPSQPPGREGETFCKHANLAPCHPASNGGATLVPSARSWQCISNANSCQLLPNLANSRQSVVERTQRKAAEAMMDIKTRGRSLEVMESREGVKAYNQRILAKELR